MKLPGWTKEVLTLLGSVLLVFTTAAFGAIFGPGEWYAELNKPAWNPPNWIFGPVWTTLYLCMAIAAWLIYRRRYAHHADLALSVYGLQLVLNAIWTCLFFGWHRMGLAFAEILLLEALIGVCIVLFWPISRVAALLFVPYFAWVGFAAFLNFTLWRMNL